MCTVAQLASAPVSPSVYPRGAAPEFYVLGTDILQDALDEAGRRMDQATWGSLYCDGLLQLAGHILSSRYPNVAQGSATEGTGGAGLRAAGDVTSIRTGDLSISYGRAASESDLGSSRYGIAFRGLEQRLAASRSPRWIGI